jgi:hypothetical protein
MGIYIDYYISSTPTLSDKTNKTELDYKSGEIIFNNSENSVISSEKIKELTGLVIAPNNYIIQCVWSTYDDHNVIRVN